MGGQDPRLQQVQVSPEQPVTTPGGQFGAPYGASVTPVPANATPSISRLSPVPSKNLGTPQGTSPVVLMPAITLNVTGREDPNGDEVDIDTKSGNRKLEVYDLRIHNEHGSIQFEGMTDLTKVDINKAVSL